jgi:hypothetical protein
VGTGKVCKKVERWTASISKAVPPLVHTKCVTPVCTPYGGKALLGEVDKVEIRWTGGKAYPANPPYKPKVFPANPVSLDSWDNRKG